MSYRLVADLPEQAWSSHIDHPEGGRMTLDDWLTTYANHVPEHIIQMQATYDAWQVEQKGQVPDPDKSLFSPLQ